MKLTEAKLKKLILEAMEEEITIDQEELDNLADLINSGEPEMALHIYESLFDGLSREQRDQIKYPLANALYKNNQIEDALWVLFPKGVENNEFEMDEYSERKMNSVAPYIRLGLSVGEYVKEFEKAGIPTSDHDMRVTGRLLIGDLATRRREVLSMASEVFGIDFSEDLRWSIYISDTRRNRIKGHINRRAFQGEGAHPYVQIDFEFDGLEAEQPERFRLEISQHKPRKLLKISAWIEQAGISYRSYDQEDWYDGTNYYVLQRQGLSDPNPEKGYITPEQTQELIEKEFGVKI